MNGYFGKHSSVILIWNGIFWRLQKHTGRNIGWISEYRSLYYGKEINMINTLYLSLNIYGFTIFMLYMDHDLLWMILSILVLVHTFVWPIFSECVAILYYIPGYTPWILLKNLLLCVYLWTLRNEWLTLYPCHWSFWCHFFMSSFSGKLFFM